MFPFRLVNPDPSKPFTIGRKSDNVLQFDNLMVSRYHAVLNFTDGKWILQSLTQNSITMLNGKDVTTAVLNDGDVILIGPRQLRATLRGADLTLLIMERETESDMQTVTLSTEWREIEIPGIGKARASKNARENRAEIKFANPLIKNPVDVKPAEPATEKIALCRMGNAETLPPHTGSKPVARRPIRPTARF